MRIKDALSAFFQSKKAATQHKQLKTPWTDSVDPEHILDQYPRPQLERDSWINLNGWWDYSITPKNDPPKKYNGKILVPYSPEAMLSGVNRHLQPDEFLWYRRFLDMDTIPQDQRLLLHFGAVDQDCIIYINGLHVGNHMGGYLSFSFDITPFLKKGRNSLMVKVRDQSDTSWKTRGKQKLNPSNMFYTAQSGIWQTVWMEWVPDVHVSKLKITPDYDQGIVKLKITTSAPVDKEICIYEGPDLIAKLVTDQIHCSLPIKDFKSWSPESPFLYGITITAGADRVKSYFAMRKFSWHRDEKMIPRLFLNNKPYFQNGVLDQGYWPDGLYTPPSDEAMFSDICNMKRLGFNMIRKHLKIEPMRWYYYCDRIGMIVWQDMINGGGRSLMTFLCYLPTALPFVTTHLSDHIYPLFSRTSKKGRMEWYRECRDTIHQLYNCPCIGMWVPFNEGWGQFDALDVTDVIKKLDKTRLVDHASGWYDQGGGDVKSVHNYFRILRVKLDRRPYVLSEYGGAAYHLEEHSYSSSVFAYHQYTSMESFSKAFYDIQRQIKQLQKKGLAAAVYTQLSDIEEETNGLYTYDRKVCKIIDQ